MAAALSFGFPSLASAHDPGLSSLEIRLSAEEVSAVLSLAPADVRIAEASGVEPFAIDSIELLVDGRALSGAIVSRRRDSTGTSVTWTFGRGAGSRLTIRSSVAARMPRGHRQLLTVRTDDGRVLVERMLAADAGATDVDFRAAQRPTGVAGQFLALGVRHILTGYDHLLFLAALLLGVTRPASVVKTVSAFTAAHSLTLTLAVVGVVRVPATIVEPLIAASIVFVGVENLVRGQIESRWKLTFAFGLIHGFGCAGALRDLGVGGAGTAIAAPLGWFNAGVEIGQIGVAMLLWPVIRRLNATPAVRARLAPVCSLLVASAGLFWMAERTLR